MGEGEWLLRRWICSVVAARRLLDACCQIFGEAAGSGGPFLAKEGDEQRLVSVGERVWCLEKLEPGSGSALLAENERKSGEDQLWFFKENEGWSARVWLQPRGLRETAGGKKISRY